MFKRNRTSSKYIYYALKLYFSGLSLRKTSEHLSHLSKETMFLFGTGFNDISQDNISEEKEGIRIYYR
jgi:nanoRNase/pAp phosphatase (c-di-AMP/oligoRNAs hydrolase)